MKKFNSVIEHSSNNSFLLITPTTSTRQPPPTTSTATTTTTTRTRTTATRTTTTPRTTTTTITTTHPQRNALALGRGDLHEHAAAVDDVGDAVGVVVVHLQDAELGGVETGRHGQREVVHAGRPRPHRGRAVGHGRAREEARGGIGAVRGVQQHVVHHAVLYFVLSAHIQFEQ